jgi:broad specificity phosphatase PhoE
VVRKRCVLLALTILVSVAAVSCDRHTCRSTTVLVVRHAEKASDDADAPLSGAGRDRALALVKVAEQAGVTAIYSSQFTRSKDTAGPLAERLGVAVTEMSVTLDAPGDYGVTLAKDVLDNHAGEAVVIVSHQNTIPAVVDALMGHAAGIEGPQCPDLFVVTIEPGGAARLVRAQYGVAGS